MKIDFDETFFKSAKTDSNEGTADTGLMQGLCFPIWTRPSQLFWDFPFFSQGFPQFVFLAVPLSWPSKRTQEEIPEKVRDAIRTFTKDWE